MRVAVARKRAIVRKNDAIVANNDAFAGNNDAFVGNNDAFAANNDAFVGNNDASETFGYIIVGDESSIVCLKRAPDRVGNRPQTLHQLAELVDV